MEAIRVSVGGIMDFRTGRWGRLV